jgi:fructokinase
VNLAVHAQQLLGPLGGWTAVVSAVGADELGARLRRELASRDVSSELVQETAEYPTGMVQVSVAPNGQPTFDIAENAAWDHIRPTEAALRLAHKCSAICFGTLAQRAPESRATIRQLIDAAPQAWRVCDLNLRQHFFDAEVIASCFEAANVVKLSVHELTLASQLLGLSDADADDDQRAWRLIEQFELIVLALTRGKQGTVLYYSEGDRAEGIVPGFPRDSQADDVGAGDSACAAIVAGLMLEWPLEQIVELANLVGAYVASQPGATPRLPKSIVELT